MEIARKVNAQYSKTTVAQLSVHLWFTRFMPEGQFNPVREPKFVIDNPQVVLNDMLSGADGFRDFAVL